MDDVASLRAAMRRELRQRRAALDAGFVAEAGAALQGWVIAHPWFVEAARVAVYVAAGGEAPTGEIVAAARAMGKRVALPRLRVDGGMEVAWWPEGVEAEIRGAGVREAAPGWAEAGPGEIDLWLVPGVAFDGAGGRLGRGRGHYDRVLAGARGWRVGLCWGFQVVGRVPVEAHDQPMDAVVTETGWRGTG